jgi:hypothetical protein
MTELQFDDDGRVITGPLEGSAKIWQDTPVDLPLTPEQQSEFNFAFDTHVVDDLAGRMRVIARELNIAKQFERRARAGMKLAEMELDRSTKVAIGLQANLNRMLEQLIEEAKP